MIEKSTESNIEGAAPTKETRVAAAQTDLAQSLMAFPGMTTELAEMLAADPFATTNINGAAEELSTSLPFRKIEYCASQEAIDAQFTKGLITDTLTMTQKETMTCILLAQKFSRVMQSKFDPSKPEQDKPLCVSHDGRVRADGEDGGTSKVVPCGQVCASCPNVRWTTDSEGKQVPPRCSEIFTLLMFDVEDQVPFIFTLRRTAISPWRKAFQALKIAGMRYRQIAPNIPANLTVQFTVGTKPERNFYRPTFGTYTAADPEMVRQMILPGFANFVENLANLNVAEVQDEEIAVATDDTEGSAAEAPSTFPGEKPTAGNTFDPAAFGRRPGTGR